MMTVKYIYPQGEEIIFPVREVRYDNSSVAPTLVGRTPCNGHVRFYRPPQQGDEPMLEHVYEGTVYVMNDFGKTVAKYDLGGQDLQGPAAARVTSVTIDPAAYSGTHYTSPHTT